MEFMKSITNYFAHLAVGFLVLTVLLTACSNAETVSEGKLSVVVTTTIIGDVVSEVAGEHAVVRSLLPPGSDPHRFDPSPSEARAIADADIIYINGVGLDAFVLDLLPSASDGPMVVDLSQNLELIGFATGEDDHEDEADHDHDGGMDPHVWMDPANVMIWVGDIAEALSAVDPGHADEYSTRSAAYLFELETLDAYIRSEVEMIPEDRRLLVTDHDSLGYFAARYGFEIVGFVVPGFSTLAQPSAQEMAALIDTIRATGVPVIFVDPSFNPALADAVAKDAGVEVVGLYTGSLTDGDGPASTYLALMQSNVRAIRENLSSK